MQTQTSTVKIGPIRFYGVNDGARVILERGRRHYRPQGQKWLLLQKLAGRVNDGYCSLEEATALADRIESGTRTALPEITID